MTDAHLIVVTGIMAAGKSTVAQALAERFPRSAHVRGDHYRRSIVGGRVEMSSDPSAEALDQLLLRYRMAISAAEAYCKAGFTTVLQDIIIGALLDDFIDLVHQRPFSLIVLVPKPTEVAKREQQRPKTGYTGFTPTQLDSILHSSTPRRGYWLDSTHLTVDQTVDLVLANLDQEARIT